jgi:cation:H+ antiporter
MLIATMLAAGLGALYFGADWLVRGGASFAAHLGLTPLMVGLTIVAYGTSSPELIVSSTAAAQGNGAIAIGNAVGSNIFNICFILGLTALICPMRVQFQLVKYDTPITIGVAVMFLLFFLDLRIALWEALAFLAGIMTYTVFNVRMARRQASQPVRQEFDQAAPKPMGALWKDLLLIIAWTGFELKRWEGAMLLAFFGGYLWYLWPKS